MNQHPTKKSADNPSRVYWDLFNTVVEELFAVEDAESFKVEHPKYSLTGKHHDGEDVTIIYFHDASRAFPICTHEILPHIERELASRERAFQLMPVINRNDSHLTTSFHNILNKMDDGEILRISQ